MKQLNRILLRGAVLLTALFLILACKPTEESDDSTHSSNAINVDTTAPTAGNSGLIAASGLTHNALTLVWSKGTDNVSPQATLTYTVYSSTSNDITSDADMAANGNVIQDATTDIASLDIAGLSEASTYYYNVVIADQAGNKTAYTPLKVTTNDITAPVPGSTGTLSVDAFTSGSVTLSWSQATDNATAQGDLKYRLYRSTTSSMDSTADILLNGTAVDTTMNASTTSKTVTGLDDGVTYTFNLLVVDESGNTAAYTKISQMTTDVTSPTPGNSGTLTQSGLTSSAVTLNWTKATDNITPQAALQYKVYRSLTDTIDTTADMAVNGTTVCAFTYDIATCSDSGLSEATPYYYNVVVQDEAFNQAAYSRKEIRTNDVTDPVPGNSGTIAIDSFDQSSISLSWNEATDNGTAQGSLTYGIYYSTDASMDTQADILANGTFDVTVDAPTVTRTISGLDDGITYYFNIIVRDTDGNTAAYSMASQKTTDVTVPTVSNGTLSVTGNTTGTSLTLNWTQANDNGSASSALQYLVYRSSTNNLDTVANMEANGTAVGSYTAGSTSKAISGLTDGTTYYYNVIVKDEGGNKAAYTMKTLTTPDITAPTAGNSGTLSMDGSTDSSLSLSWTAASDNVTTVGNLQYRLYYASTNTLTTIAGVEAGTPFDATFDNATTSKTVTGLDDGLTYYLNLLVWDEAGNKAVYTMANGKTADVTAPDVSPDIITASIVTDSSLTLNWTRATDNGSAQASLQYRVYEATSDTIPTVSDMQANGTMLADWTTDIATWDVSGLDDGTPYWFNVMVKDESGNIAAYAAKSVTTNDVTSPVPGALGLITVGTVTDSSVDLSWTQATDNGTSQGNLKYQVFYATDASVDTLSNIDQYGTNVGDTTYDALSSIVIDGLSEWTTYYLNVVAIDAEGNRAAYTMENTKTDDVTVPTAGSFGATTVPTAGTLTLNWSVASDSGTATANLQYRVYKSSSDNISTVAEMESNGTALNAYTTNITTLDATGLNDETTYTFNLIVTDEAGNKTAYTRISETTPVWDPVSAAQSASFTDEDGNVGQIAGTMTITKAVDESDIDNYVLYWGNGTTTKLSSIPIATLPATGADFTHDFSQDTAIYYDATADTTADTLLVFTQNEFGEMSTGVNAAINDRTVPYYGPTSITFPGGDEDGNGGWISGTIYISRAVDESDITNYLIYWGLSESAKDSVLVDDLALDGTGDVEYYIPPGSTYPTNATHFIACSENEGGENADCVSVPFTDWDAGGGI